MTLRTILISTSVALAFAFAAVPAHSMDQGIDFSFGRNAYHYTADSFQEALGIFPFNDLVCVIGCTLSQGYLVAGRLREAGESRYRPAILTLDDDGIPDASVGVNGWVVAPALLNSINDVAYDSANRRMYFVGTRFVASTFNVFTVVCVDVDQGNACAGFGLLGSGVVQRQYESADYSSSGERIVFDPDLGLIVTGIAAKTSDGDGEWLGVARLDAATGDFINAFSSDGSRIYSYQPRMFSNSIRPYAMALSPVPAADGKRHLYIGGEYRSNADVHDSFLGFVTAINPLNGNGIGNFGGDNTAWHQIRGYWGTQTAVLAMNVQANGKLTILGRTEYDYAGIFQRRPLFVRLQANGVPDDNFCSTSGVAIGCTEVGGQTWTVSTHNHGAIVERPDNRDLVFFFPDNAHMLQVSANATVRRSGNSMMLYNQAITAAYPYAAAWDWSGTDRMVFAGSYFNSDTGLREFAVARTMTDDTIFADTFGGVHSD